MTEKLQTVIPIFRVSMSRSSRMPFPIWIAEACRLNISFPSEEICFIKRGFNNVMIRSRTSETVNSFFTPATFAISSSSSCTLMVAVPFARIGIPPGIFGAGIFTGFCVPHCMMNSLVLMKSTSARRALSKPNLKPFRVDRKGMMSDSISNRPSSLNTPSIRPL